MTSGWTWFPSDASQNCIKMTCKKINKMTSKLIFKKYIYRREREENTVDERCQEIFW